MSEERFPQWVLCRHRLHVPRPLAQQRTPLLLETLCGDQLPRESLDYEWLPPRLLCPGCFRALLVPRERVRPGPVGRRWRRLGRKVARARLRRALRWGRLGPGPQ